MSESVYSVEINRQDGTVKITGADKVWVAAQLERLASVYEGEGAPTQTRTKPNPKVSNSTTRATDAAPKARRRSGGAKASIDPDLQARLTPDVKASLLAYKEERETSFKKQPAQAAIIATYLQDELAMEGVTPDHMCTVYKVMGWEAPSSYQSQLKNARTRNKYFTQVGGLFVVTNKGENFARVGSKGDDE